MEEFLSPEADREKLDREKAEHYFKESLEGESLVKEKQNPDCEIALVVPVYDELSDRILGQIESLTGQEGVHPEQFEAFYVVNNGPDDGSKRFKRVSEMNERVLRLPIWKNMRDEEAAAALEGLSAEERERFRNIREKFNFFAIDKSSSGRAMSAPKGRNKWNVGNARNRGLAEASKRFDERGKNGIIIQSDADARFDDTRFLEKVGAVFRENPDAIAAAGGIEYEFSPDTTPEFSREVGRYNEMLMLLKQAKRLSQSLWSARYRQEHPGESSFSGWKGIGFSGANMISRSFEPVITAGLDPKDKDQIGGIRSNVAGEDSAFCHDLTILTESRGKKILDLKGTLRVKSALRESERTYVSNKAFVRLPWLKGKYWIEDPFVEKKNLWIQTRYVGWA